MDLMTNTHNSKTSTVVPKEDAKFRFDYLSKLFSTSNRIALEKFLEGKSRGPTVVDFDPTTACNFTCPECISAGLLNKERIPDQRVLELMHEFSAAGVKGIVFIGGGEPLAHRCMPEPIRLAHQLGMLVGLTTNGSLIDRYLDTLAECVSWTRVSMDAGTHDTFLKFRPNKLPDSFNMILRSMEALARKKKGALGYSFLMMSRLTSGDMVTNVGEISKACKIAKNIGCDYFEVKPMFNMSHELIPFSQELDDIISDQIAEAKTFETADFHVVATGSVSHIKSSKDINQRKHYTSCPTMGLRTTVTPSGIYPCAYHRGATDKILGTVHEGPFDQFWNGAQHKQAANSIDPSRDCNFFCARHKMNLTLLALSELKEQGVDLLPHLKANDIDDIFF